MLAMQAVMRADHAKSSSLTDAKTTPPITCVCVCVCVFVCVCLCVCVRQDHTSDHLPGRVSCLVMEVEVDILR